MSGQQVPAWKRLGLKLKQPTGSDPVIGSPVVGHPSSTGHGQPNKRKLDAPPPPALSPYGSKKPRTDGQGTTLKKQKSVTFGDTPTKKDLVSSARASKTPTKQPQPKSKGPSKKQTPASTDLQPALDYLRQWKSSRANWKFNKNHQSSLIKHVFDSEAIPPADIDTFYQYIRDLKGYVRVRLREAAMEVRTQDEASGSAGFPEGTMDLDAKQATYQSVLTELLHNQTGNKRKSFHEVEYVATSQDGNVIIRRVVKRMRAEIVMEELSDDSGETETTTTSSSSETITASDTNNNDGEMVMERQAKAPEGSNRRRRKLRVNMDDSSSSESESDSDSETSSSSSSDDSDSDEDDEMGGQNDDETSSSSSSSSESDSSEESDSDEDSELADA